MSNLFQTSRTTQSLVQDGFGGVGSSQISRVVKKGDSLKSTALQTAGNYLLNTAEGQQVVAGVTSAAASAVTSIAKGVGSAFTDLFSTKRDATVKAVKPLSDDPISGNTSVTSPQSGYYKTSTLTSTITSVDVAKSGAANSAIKLGADGNLSIAAAAAARGGFAVPVNDAQYVSLQTTTAATHSTGLIGSIFSQKNLMTVANIGISVATDTRKTTNFNNWSSMATSFAPRGSSFGSIAAGSYNSNLPTFAQANGVAVPGYSTTITPDMSEVFRSGATRYNITNTGIDQGRNYSDEQNLFNGVFAAAVTSGATAYVSAMAANSQSGKSTQAVAQKMLPSVVNSPSMTKALVDIVGPSNVRGSQSLLNNTAKNPGKLSSADVAAIGTLASALGKNVLSPVQSPQRGSNNEIIWSKPGVVGANKQYAVTYVPEEVRAVAFATPIIPVAGDPFITGGF